MTWRVSTTTSSWATGTNDAGQTNVFPRPGVLNFLHTDNTTAGTATDSDICTGHFAPLDEAQECDETNYNDWHERFNAEPEFARNQYQLQTRMEWMTSTTTGSDLNEQLCFTPGTTGGNTFSQQTFTQFNPMPEWQQPETITWGPDLSYKEPVIDIKLRTLFSKIPKRLIKKMTEFERERFKAKQRSERLLKMWLSPKEYQGLKYEGYLQIPDSKNRDLLYIVKQAPHQMVEVKENGKLKERLCVVAKMEDRELPIGDQLLQKILLLKSNPKQFKEIAVHHG